MLKKTYEWLRVVHPRPDNEIVEARTKAVTELLGKLDAADDEDLLGALATAAVAGFEGKFDAHSVPVATVVESIRNHQPAFPADLTENALELRITCALALGELVTRAMKKGQQANAVLAASLLIAGSGLRPEERGKHLRAATSELLAAAREAVQTRATEVRERDVFDLRPLEEYNPPGDLPTFWRQLSPILRDLFAAADKRARSDREELEVLWWFYNSYSEMLEKPLGAVPADVAALACGAEVGRRVLLPPHAGVAEMVAGAVVRDRKKPELAAKPLAKLVSGWDEAARKVLLPTVSSARQFATDFPALLPLTWLSVRLDESHGASGWEDEFGRRASIPAESEAGPGALARQAFWEQVTQRLLVEGSAE